METWMQANVHRYEKNTYTEAVAFTYTQTAAEDDASAQIHQ